jgi:serine/threonine protein kinase/tetratricopeptide (TPR) repeat protein
VFRCRHEPSGRDVAVKTVDDPTLVANRLLRKEAAILSRLSGARHEALVEFVVSGIEVGRPYYVMEFISDWDLAAFRRWLWGLGGSSPAPTDSFRAARERRTDVAGAGFLPEVLVLLRQLAGGLAFVHGHGIVHGDLSPKNVMLRDDGRPVIIDFGSAAYASSGRAEREPTELGSVLHGTPGYMAPERLQGAPVDARTDLYALGCISFELITGRQPISAEEPAALRAQHLRRSPPAVSSVIGEVPDRLSKLVGALLEKDPRARPGFADDVVAELDQLADLPRATPRRVQVPCLFSARFAGRGEIKTRLRQRLDDLHQGRGGCVFLTGESGIGKTRLSNELCSWAMASGIEVITTSAQNAGSELGGGAALELFAPFLLALADLVRTHPELGSELDEALPVLAQYEPSLARDGAAASPAVELPAELGRLRVLRNLLKALQVFGRRRPLLLVLDDLQWADELSLAFLDSELAESLSNERVLLVSAVREELLGPRLASVLRRFTAAIEPLGRLSVRELHSIVTDMLASDQLPPGLTELAYEQSEGNPLFAAEWLQTAVSERVLERDPGGKWRLNRATGEGPGLPASLRELLKVRFRDLTREQEAVLDLAAVLDREVDAELLTHVVTVGSLDGSPSVDVSALASILDVLVSRRILDELGPGKFRFLHDKVREVRRASVSPERRRLLHRLAALYLERRQQVSGAPDARLGHHWAEAGVPAKAYEHWLAAAHRADRGHAPELAMRLFAGALAQATLAGKLQPDEWRERLASVAESLADVMQRLARHAEARDQYERALGFLSPDSRLARARLLRKKAQSYWTVHEYDEAELALSFACAELSPLDPTSLAMQREWIDVQQGRFWLAYYGQRLGAESESVLGPLLETVERWGTPTQRAAVSQCRANELMVRTRYRYQPEVAALLERTLEALGEDAAFDRAVTRFDLGFAYLLGERSDCLRAAALLEKSALEAEAFGDTTLFSRATIYLTIARRRLGDVAATRALAPQAFDAAAVARLQPYIAAAEACLAWCELREGSSNEALARLRRADAIWRDGAHPFPFRWLSSLVALALAYADGDASLAASSLSSLLHPSQQLLPEPITSLLDPAANSLDRGDWTSPRGPVALLIEAACRSGHL